LRTARATGSEVGGLRALPSRPAVRAGNLLGLVLAPLLLGWLGWRGLFFIFGALGLPLLLLWQRVVPERGATATGAPPRPALGALRLLSSPATWAILVVNVVNHWGYFIYLNWMPSYFYKARARGLRGIPALSPRVVFCAGLHCMW
jgi:cyanate permease